MLTFYLALSDNEQDQLRFESLYNRYRKQMLLLAQTVLHNTYDAEDAVHEAFLGVARNMNSINKITNETDIRNYLLKQQKTHRLIYYLRKKSKIRQLRSIP